MLCIVNLYIPFGMNGTIFILVVKRFVTLYNLYKYILYRVYFHRNNGDRN